MIRIASLLLLPALFACAPSQRDECIAYLACQAAVDAEQGSDGLSNLEPTYGEGGSCWASTPEVADNCAQACLDGMDANLQFFPDISECRS